MKKAALSIVVLMCFIILGLTFYKNETRIDHIGPPVPIPEPEPIIVEPFEYTITESEATDFYLSFKRFLWSLRDYLYKGAKVTIYYDDNTVYKRIWLDHDFMATLASCKTEKEWMEIEPIPGVRLVPERWWKYDGRK